MARVITFSTQFPKGHPKEGKPTNFVPKLINALRATQKNWEPVKEALKYGQSFVTKNHTIREGNRFKRGDTFSPHIWTGTPYRSKQLTIGPDVLIYEVMPIVIEGMMPRKRVTISGHKIPLELTDDVFITLAKNDGLNVTDFFNWFNKPHFEGQIILFGQILEYPYDDLPF